MDHQQRFWNFYKASLDWKNRLLGNEQVVNDRLTMGASGDKSKRGQPVSLLDRHQQHADRSQIGDQAQSGSQTNELDIDSAESDELISDEFLAFIAQTRLHQLEREKRKQELARKEEDEVEYKDLSELENRIKLIELKGPELREDLYGENAEEIYSKELKLQFGFNEFCDKYQPKFWPMIPINLSIKQ